MQDNQLQNDSVKVSQEYLNELLENDSIKDSLIDSLTAVTDSLSGTAIISDVNWVDKSTIIILAVTTIASIIFYYKSIKQNTESKKKEWKHFYYELIVMDPVFKITNEYIEEIKRVLSKFNRSRKTNKSVSRLLENFDELHKQFHIDISNAFEGWEEEKDELRNKTLDEIIALEDSIIMYIAKESTNTDTRIVLESCLKTQGEISKFIMSFDPYMS